MKQGLKGEERDHGFFILATQSFIERVMKDRFPAFDHDFLHASFKDNLYEFRNYLKSQTPGNYLKQWEAFGRIAHQQMRNLFYVAMTMEHFNFFVKEGSEDVLVEELVGLMG